MGSEGCDSWPDVATGFVQPLPDLQTAVAGFSSDVLWNRSDGFDGFEQIRCFFPKHRAKWNRSDGVDRLEQIRWVWP